MSKKINLYLIIVLVCGCFSLFATPVSTAFAQEGGEDTAVTEETAETTDEAGTEEANTTASESVSVSTDDYNSNIPQGSTLMGLLILAGIGVLVPLVLLINWLSRD